VLQAHADGYNARPLLILTHLLLPWRWSSLGRRLRQIDADLIVVNMSGLENGWLYKYASRFVRARVICWLHNPFEFARLIQGRGWRHTVHRGRDLLASFWARPFAGLLHSVSPSSSDYLLRRLGQRTCMTVMRNVVAAPERMTPPVDLSKLVFEKFVPLTIAVVPGRIDFGHKGQDRLVASLTALAQRGIAIVFVGDGGDADALKALCAAHRNVFFAGWSDNIDGYLKAADVVLIPSRFESQGLILLEVLHQRIPVLVSAIPSFEEVLDSRFVDGFDDPASLCASIERVVAMTPAQLNTLYETALAPFSPRVVSADVASIFEGAPV
jgi:glycosyltransferase involved in cell wall biosynthesis